MGKQDLLAKKYMSDNEKFADVFNYYLYNGKQVIKPENLHEESISEIALPYSEKNKNTFIEKYRDIIKRCVVKSDNHYTYFLLGIENQSEVHYAMPVRNMLYDSLNYSGQVSRIEKNHKKCKDKLSSAEYLSGVTKSDKITPVITLVLYWGNEAWDGPKSLYEMFKETDLDILRYVNDYHINLIEPKDIKDFSKFRTELGKVLEFINASDSLAKMKEILENNHEYYLHMDLESARMIETFGKAKIDMKQYEKNKEEVDMCKAIEDMILEGKQEGIQEGIKALIEVAKELGATTDIIEKKVEEKFNLLSDGMFVLIDNDGVRPIIISIDVNGYNKKPNKWGHDLFTFQILNDSGKIVPMGAAGTYYANENLYCSKTSTHNLNGAACAYKAFTDANYFKNLP